MSTAVEVRSDRITVTGNGALELDLTEVSEFDTAGLQLILVLRKRASQTSRPLRLVQEISAASQEQSTGVRQINSAMTQLSQTTQQNAAASEELASTAEEMSAQARTLQEAMAFFKIDGASTTVAPRKKAVAAKRAARPAPVIKNALAFEAAGVDEADFGKFE